MRDNRKNRQVFEAVTMVLQFSITMLVSIGMCTAFGIWLGNRIGMNWMMIPFFFLGAVAGGTSVYKMIRRFLHQDDRDKRNKSDVEKTQ